MSQSRDRADPPNRAQPRQGGGPWLTTGINAGVVGAHLHREKAVNRALAGAPAPVERGVARLKAWRTFHRARAAPTA